MIGYIEGRILDRQDDGILLLAGNVGYEILVSRDVLDQVGTSGPEDVVSLYIYYHQTDRQPKPVLIGFNTQEEKAFFQLFISVDAIGPLKAVKAMEKSVEVIASAIENGDVEMLSSLRGIGKRTAQKIIAALRGKVQEFVGSPGQGDQPGQEFRSGVRSNEMLDIVGQVVEVLVGQLGHTAIAAKRMVAEALVRNEAISTPEELFDEIYRGGAS